MDVWNEGKESPYRLKLLRPSIISAYEESGLFSKVELGPSDADLQVEIRILERIDSSPVQEFLCLITLGIIPNYGRFNVEVVSTLKNRNGDILGVFEHSQGIKFVQEILLYPLFGIFASFNVEKKVIYDIQRLSISEAYAGGTLISDVE